MYSRDPRVVMTLDAGGTNFVFSATRGNEEIVAPVTLPSRADDLNACLETLVEGFSRVNRSLDERPVAISFAFPGPADYENGIIGDLKNLPAFRGGIPLGAFLQERFGVPVFINNDGDLFAYGEALAGALPWVNRMLEKAGKAKRYRNLTGVTLGTGFGCGVVRDGELCTGDNGAAAEAWVIRGKRDPRYGTEEGISIRAIKREYAALSGDHRELTPRDIHDIAAGTLEGNADAAREAFARAGEVLGDALATINTIVDGVAVIGGGIARAREFLMPAAMRALNGYLESPSGELIDRMEMKAFFLDDPDDAARFLAPSTVTVPVPGTRRTVEYDPVKRMGVMITRLGTSKAVALGAYAFALNKLDRR
ncbi:MAG: ROK family protein [Odoribacteraceae bacterium]|jgi:glucokinase|nr:ROK family protein [Odoribacteraceae bacterium]